MGEYENERRRQKRTYGSFKLRRVAATLIIRRCRVGVFGVLGVGVGLSTVIRGDGVVCRRCVGDLLWGIIRCREIGRAHV